MKLLDANIVIYAMGREHPHKEPCARIVHRMGMGSHDYTVDAETLQEILHVFDYRGERAVGAEAVRRLLVLCPRIAPVTARELEVALGIYTHYPALASRDAIHAAVVHTQRLEGIVTTDKAFRQIQGLHVFDPLELTIGG